MLQLQLIFFINWYLFQEKFPETTEKIEFKELVKWQQIQVI